MERKYNWYKLADNEIEIPFQANNMAVMEVNGKNISIARFGEGLFAFPHKCPHASGVLSDGWIDAKGNVVCPVHQYRFNLETGRNITGEGYHLRQWPVEKRAAGVFVRMEEE